MNNEVINKLGKIHVDIFLENGLMSNGDPRIKVHIRNDYVQYSIDVFHLAWINLKDHQIVTMNGLQKSINLRRC